MKLAISNIAWEKKDNEKIYLLMKKYWFIWLEIAPTKIFDNIENIDENDINIFKEKINMYWLKLVSMQSLTFWRPDLQLFKTPNALNNHLEILILLANKLWINSLVFGSPKNRIFENISKEEAAKKASIFFDKIWKFAYSKWVNICIEANPDIYGWNFLLNTFETLEFVKKVNTPWIKLHLDLWTIIANNEDINKLKWVEKFITHFHISEPYLEIIKNRTDHKKIIEILKNYNWYYSIEMKWTNIENVEKTLKLISNIYK